MIVTSWYAYQDLNWVKVSWIIVNKCIGGKENKKLELRIGWGRLKRLKWCEEFSFKGWDCRKT